MSWRNENRYCCCGSRSCCRRCCGPKPASCRSCCSSSRRGYPRLFVMAYPLLPYFQPAATFTPLKKLLVDMRASITYSAFLPGISRLDHSKSALSVSVNTGTPALRRGGLIFPAANHPAYFIDQPCLVFKSLKIHIPHVFCYSHKKP